MATRQQQNNIQLRKITDFKSKLTGGGARPNLFEVELAFPGAVGVDNDTLQKARFLVKAAALPASTVAPIDVPFRGRILKIAGDRTFETWTITVINIVDNGNCPSLKCSVSSNLKNTTSEWNIDWSNC